MLDFPVLMEVRMIRKTLFTLFMLVGIVLSASCNPAQISPTSQANLPNPASVYCEQNGGKLDFRQDTSGGVAGVCSSRWQRM
jgi:putative hemolysin